jgi:outer membrane lipoprotein-sorting protein
MSRLLAVLLFLTACLAPARADELGVEVARKHAERAGAKLAALKSYFAEGRTLINGEVVQFQLWAARPNRLRVESFTAGRRVVQCFDGRHEPWIAHTAVAHGNPEPMAPADAKDFVANSDFDDPLVDSAAKGYTVDYAGEEEVEGQKAAKLLVMSATNDVLFIWVDNASHEIVKRSFFRIDKNGDRQVVDTYFGDFRDIGGVLQPHRVETRVGAATLYLMVTSHMDANSPLVTDATFTPPPGWMDYQPPKANSSKQ